MSRSELLRIARLLIGVLFVLGIVSSAQAAPVITNLNPTSAPAGGSLTIGGSGFGTTQGSSTVTVDGQPVTLVYSWSSVQLSVQIPLNTTSGNVVVTVGGKQSNAVALTIQAAPAITQVSASSGPIGKVITITGTNLVDSNGISDTYVTFYPAGSASACGFFATPTSASGTSVVAKVPAGATTGEFAVQVDSVDSNPLAFTVTGKLAPIADAGLDQQVSSVGATVDLNGSASYDLNGLPLTYSWSLASVPVGSKAVIANPTSPLPSFVPDVAGPYEVSLVVKNGSFSSPAAISTVVALPWTWGDPIVNAGPDQTVSLGSIVQLDASATTDIPGLPITSYHWELWYLASNTSQWVFQGSTPFTNPNSLNPTFVASSAGSYFAILWVQDSYLASLSPFASSSPAVVKISTVNSQPIASAGPAQTVSTAQTVQLDGTGSTDVDGNSLTYSWSFLSKPSGSTAALSSNTYPQPTFNLDVVGNYLVQLIVNDGTVKSLPTCSTTSASRTSSVIITNSEITPVANPGPAQTVSVGGVVTLNGADSVDYSGHTLSYSWSLISKPTGSAAALTSSTTANPYFTADVTGKYAVQLVVNDGVTSSAPQIVLISTDNSRPVANPGPHQIVLTGGTVQLNGADSSDADGNVLTYKWAILYQPSGANAVLSNVAAEDPTFVASTAGLYVVQLIVNDGQLNSAPVTTWIKAQTNQAPVVSAGPNQAITLPVNRVTLQGSATDDGLPNGTLIVSWTQISGPGTVTFSSPATAVTDATFSAAGVYVLQISANDSQLTSTATTTITVNSPPPVIVLAPSGAGPDVTGTSQSLTATVTVAGVPVANASVLFTVSGANNTNGNATTNSSGVATFSYTGTAQGTDTAQASYGGSTSNTAAIAWVTPVQIVSTTTVLGRFFPNQGNSCSFNISPTTTPSFTQEFPTIDFNPPAGTIKGNTSNVNDNTRPFTDVTTDLNGNFTGTIVAQGNGLQAGVGPQYGPGGLFAFETVFTSNLIIAKPGNATIRLWDDDGIILGIGGGATLVSGPSTGGTNPGPNTPFASLPVIYYYNQVTFGGPQGFSLVVNFPSAGTYPYELDYVECDGGQLAMTMTVGASGAPPTGSLVLSPASPASINVGQTETMTVQASDASGVAIPNLGVALIIDGPNQQALNSTTNSSGLATFSYNGVNGGTDSVQAVANITGMAALSNVADVPWSVPSGGGCSVFYFTPQGWIGSPLIGALVQAPTPITLASGITLTSGTLKMFPSANPNQITVLNSNTTGTGPLTLATIDPTTLANGEYTIQLEATSSAGSCQLNEIVVSVTGDFKPGRETVTVTDFKVPLAGIPISITRIYDSLNRGSIGDFGNGWNLGWNVQLSVDQLLNVTLTLDGKAQTFYFTPQSGGNVFFPWLILPAYTPQPGLFGTLTSNGCGALIQVGGALVQDAAGVACFPAGSYAPTVYTYTDPAGRVYTIASTGQLQSIKDLNGNTLTFAPSGITSSVGGVVIPFIRDSQGRITKITDLNQNNYIYSYDTCGTGDLCSVTYPGISTPAQYTYTPPPDNSLLTRTDPNNNTWVDTYFTDGRLKTETSPSVSNSSGQQVQYVTQYCYNVETQCSGLAANTTAVTNPDGGVVTTTYDSFGKPLQVVDPLGNTTTYTYYANETLHTKVDPLKNPAWQYIWDTNGFLTSVTDPLNHTTTYKNNQYGGVTYQLDALQQNPITTNYDPFFNPISASDTLGQLYTKTYDSIADILTQSDANGNTTQFTYDSRGNLTKIVDPLNEATTFTYDSMNRVLSRTDPRNNQTQFAYDALGNPTDITDALGRVWRSTFDFNGNKTSDIDALGRTTSYTFDALNRLVKTIYPDKTTKTYVYDWRNNKLTETDQSGRVTQYVYDLAGELKNVTYAYGTPDAGTVQYTYDADGNRKTVTDELNNQTTYFYDPANRLTSIQDATPQHNTTIYGYDADNRLTSVEDPNKNTISYTPDARGRLQTTTYPDTTTDKYTYDGVGNRKSKTDQALNTTNWNYDLVNRLLSVQDPLKNLTQYGYDPAGDLLSISDANSHVTSFQYDALNRKVTRTLPLNMYETFAYDEVGNVSANTNFNGKTTTFKYDTLNRLLSKTPDPSLSQPTISFTYYPTGTRQTMSDATGTTNYTYDNRDRLKTKATPEGTLSYTYDAHGNLKTIASSNTNGASVSYTPDVLNRLSTVTDNRLLAQGVSNPVTTYGYDPAGNMSGYTYSANGLASTYSYDTLNRLSGVTWAKGTSTVSSFAYTPYPAGNVHTVTELSNRSVTYVYDNDYHLKSETIASDPNNNNGFETYTYDAVGNRKTLTSTIPSLPGSNSYNYDNNDRLTTDTYDNNGNTTASGGISYTYDFQNSVLMAGTIVNVYDGDGNRVSQTVGSTKTTYLVDTLNPTGYSQVMDELVNGSVTRTFTYGLRPISENQLVSGTWTPSFYGFDGHGNARFLANTSGTLTDNYQFDAFGMSIFSSGTTSNPFRYSGERFDSNLNFYYLRARYYNMLTGRFMTMDPGKENCCASRTSQVGNIFDPATLHKYVYAANNPVNRFDPTGRGIEEDAEFEAWLAKEEVEIKKTAFELCVEAEIANLSVQELYEGFSLAELTIKAIANCEAKGWIY